MLIILPTTAATDKASAFLLKQAIAHRVLPVPESLGYKTGSDTAIYLAEQPEGIDVPMLLTRERFVVMRVFKAYVHEG